MANECINYNCNDSLGTHLLNDCGDENLGGGKHMILFECDYTTTDFTNGTQVNADITAGRATLVKNLKIGVPARTPVTVPSNVACQTDRVATYDQTLTGMDGNVNAQNVDFWTTVGRGRSFAAVMIYECAEDRVSVIEDEVKFTTSKVFPDNDTEHQRFEFTGAWRSLDLPQIFSAPSGVF